MNRTKNFDDTNTHVARRFGLLEVIVATVTYLAVQIGGGIILVLALGTEAVVSQDPTATVWLVGVAAISALIAAFVANVIRVRSPAAIGLAKTGGRWLLIGAGAGLLGFLINRLVIVLYVWISGDTSNPQQGMADTAMGGSLVQFVLLVILGGLLAPLGEELLFRGVLFGWLRRWGFVLAAGISALVFGIAHGLNVVFPAAIVLGLLNAYVYEKSGSIWPSVIAHATNNVLIFVLARLAAELGLLNGT